MELLIDGVAVEFEIGDCRAGWCDVFVMGLTLTGRCARVACHRVPEDVIRLGGAVRTGGHTFHVRKV